MKDLKDLMFAALFVMISQSSLAVTVTPVNIDGDLSGQYRFTAKNGEATMDFTFFLVKTPLTLKLGDRKEVNFYGLSKSWYENVKEREHLLGVFMTSDERVPNYHRLQYLYVSKGKPIDGESSILLSQENNTLIFGGDFENYELFRIEKISDKLY